MVAINQTLHHAQQHSASKQYQLLQQSVVRYFPDRDANLSINQEWWGIKLSSMGTI